MSFKYGAVTAPGAGMELFDFSGAETVYRGQYSALFIVTGGDVRFQDELGNIHFIEDIPDFTVIPVRVSAVFQDDEATPIPGEVTDAVVYGIIP